MAFVEFDEIVALHDHVVEFEEGERAFAFEAGFDAIEA